MIQTEPEDVERIRTPAQDVRSGITRVWSRCQRFI